MPNDLKLSAGVAVHVCSGLFEGRNDVTPMTGGLHAVFGAVTHGAESNNGGGVFGRFSLRALVGLTLASMRILIFHGYLLRGTGSNVYNAELARALATAGHDVHLLCQDSAPEELVFVDAVGSWDGGELSVRQLDRVRPSGWGSCSVYRPPIGSVLPVYVADRYEGFDARPFNELSDAELELYLAANIDAVRDVATLGAVQCALANHLVMGPVILARGLPSGVPYAVKIHGSALEYIVAPYPQFLPYAEEGMAACRTALVGSGHTARRLWDVIDDPELPGRTLLGPPGVDVEAFRPRDATAQEAGLELLERELLQRQRSGFSAQAGLALDHHYARWSSGAAGADESLAADLAELRTSYNPSGIDELAPVAAREVLSADGPLIVFVGKLIVSKGVDLLLAAFVLVRQKYPAARLAIVGFGNYREGLELLVRALDGGNVTGARELAAAGWLLEGGQRKPLRMLDAFLGSLTEAQAAQFAEAGAGVRGQVSWFGRIEHDLLVSLVTAADVQVVPSTFPEAFGMVAAEAAACGVPPICAHHSGLAEVTDQLEAVIEGDEGGALSFELSDSAVLDLAQRIVASLALPEAEKATRTRALAALASERFSWSGVASNVLSAATAPASDTQHN